MLRPHVWEQKHLVLLFERKTIPWKISFKNCCKNNRLEIRKILPISIKSIISNPVKSELFWDFLKPRLFAHPLLKFLIANAKKAKLTTFIDLLKNLQMILKVEDDQKKLLNQGEHVVLSLRSLWLKIWFYQTKQFLLFSTICSKFFKLCVLNHFFVII